MKSKTATGPASARATESHTTFFRQSGWLVVATVASGVFMTAVHVVVNKRMEPSEYSIFFTLLRIFLLMSIPSAGLQIVFAQQTAAAVSDAQHRQLAATVRAVLRGTFLLWLGMVAVALAWQPRWVALLKITNPAALWATILIGLTSLWLPVLKGALQGVQNFAGLGWVLILDGVGRFAAILIMVWLGGQAAGAMTGALIGQVISFGVCAWLIRDLLRAPGDDFQWKPWLCRVLPLTLGIGTLQLMTNTDVVFVQSIFSADKTPLYMPAAMIGSALVTFTGPLAAVMFPKVVRSAALTQDTRALRHALGATALLSGGAALACTLLPKLPLQIIYFGNRTYWAAWPLVPWFAWCLLPLVLANVLIGNLLARERFAMVPWLVLVATGYGIALATLRPRLLAMEQFHAFRAILQTLGVSNLSLLGVALFFTWREKVRVAARAP